MISRPTFTLDQLAGCAERELRFRRRVYARRVSLGKMKQTDADREIALMEAIHTHLSASGDLFGGRA